MPSRTSILETIPLVISNPPKLKSKSTIGAIESAFFHTRSFIANHRIVSSAIFIISFAVAAVFARRRLLKRGSLGGYGGGILGIGNGGGFFRLDGKEGILNGGSSGKVD